MASSPKAPLAKPSANPFQVGDRVSAKTNRGDCEGWVFFTGKTHFGDGEWVGVVLDEPVGLHGGVRDGYTYFHCKDKYGMFGRPENMTKLAVSKAEREEACRLRDPKGTRANLFRELVDTEASYLAGLSKCASEYIQPLQAIVPTAGKASSDLGSVIKDRHVAVLFSNAQQLLTLNRELYAHLEAGYKERVDKENDGREPIGALFVKYAPLFELYSQYAVAYTDALSSIAEFRQHHPEVAAFLEERAKACGSTIDSLLIMPIQRVPRYIMLLSELSACVPPMHPDYQSMWAAITLTKGAADKVNEAIRRHETHEKLLEIQARFKDPSQLLAHENPDRALIQEAELTKISNRGGLKKKATFLLFNDVLVYAAGKKNGLELRCKLKLEEIQVKLPEQELLFDVVFRADDTRAFGVLCGSAAERTQWVAAVAAAIDAREAAAAVLQKQQSDNLRIRDTIEATKSVAAPQWAAERKRNKRLNVAAEIAESEKAYVSSICTALEVFIRPLLIAVPSEKVDSDFAIFCNSIEQIYTLNSKLLQDLEERLAGWSHNTQLGDIFQQFAPLFKLYSEYSKNHAHAMEVIMGDPFAGLIFDISTTPDASKRTMGQSLNSYLIMPVQRVPRYALLLKELAKETTKFHGDYEDLNNALQAVKDTAVHIDEAIRQNENIMCLYQIQKRYAEKLDLVHKDRYLVLQGHVQKTNKTNGTRRMYWLFLFNDLFLYAEEITRVRQRSLLGRFQNDPTIVNSKLKLHGRWNRKELVNVQQGAVPAEFLVKSTMKTLTITAETEGQAKDWVDALQSVIRGESKPYKLELRESVPTVAEDLPPAQGPRTTTQASVVRAKPQATNLEPPGEEEDVSYDEEEAPCKSPQSAALAMGSPQSPAQSAAAGRVSAADEELRGSPTRKAAKSGGSRRGSLFSKSPVRRGSQSNA